MQKQAPSVGRILVAVGFALSCFGLLLFLWVTFGGPIAVQAEELPLHGGLPRGDHAREGGRRADRRRLGRQGQGALACRRTGNATGRRSRSTPQYAPISSDAQAILRQKTLLGETYIELTTGSAADATAPTAARRDVGQISAEPRSRGRAPRDPGPGSTQIDEIFQALDQQTRKAFQSWMQNSAVAVHGRSLDLNDAFGNLGPFTTDATNVLRILNAQQSQLQGLVRDTGTVFDAISARDSQLALGDHQLQRDLPRDRLA